MSKSHDVIPRLVSAPIGVSYLFTRNPWVSVWWSVILPGFGHIHLGQNLIGFVLMGWEILINHFGHINMAIYYTVHGDIDKAKAVIDYRWAILYPLFYIFAMVDSYRVALDNNNISNLERLQKKRRFDRINISSLGTHTLDRRNPTIAALWSMMMPGLGHLYCNRIVKAMAVTMWYLSVVLKSGLTLAAFYTIRGEFHKVPEVVDYQWLLFWPSVYTFAIGDAYSDAIEQNNIAGWAFRWRMRKYLKNEDVRKGGKPLM